MTARALDFPVGEVINEPRSQPNFLCTMRPESHGHQEARILGMS